MPASGTFSQYTAGPYRGEHRNNPSAPQQGQTYYNTRNHSWYYAVSAGLGSFVWAQTSIENALSANARWLGEQDDDATAASVLINFSNSLRYYFYNTSTGHVEFLDNSTYADATNEMPTYVAEPISNPAGLGTINGIVVENGLTGGGTSNIVTIGIDVTSANFPIMPLDHGGTGADTAADARDNLGLGTVATLDTGIMAGNVPALDSNGNLVIDVFPDSVTLDTEVPTFIADFLSRCVDEQHGHPHHGYA